MVPQSRDTSPRAEQVQLALLRQAGIPRRLALAQELTRLVLALSRHGVRSRHPAASPSEVERIAFRQHYGSALAEGINRVAGEARSMDVAPDLLGAVLPIIEVFERLGIAYYVGGSVASSVYGIPRATLDVDLVADVRPEHVQSLVQALQADYYLDEQAIREAIARQGSFNLISLATMLKVDVFIRKRRPFDDQAFARVRSEAATQGSAVPTLALPSAEDMVLAKLEWYRLGGEISDQQWNDILGMLKVQGAALDLAYLRQTAPQLAIADLLERALVEAGLVHP